MSIVPVTERGPNTGSGVGDEFSSAVWDAVESMRHDIFSSLDNWDPFTRFPLSSSLSFPRFFSDPFAPVRTRVDWRETRDAHLFEAHFPGLRSEDVVIEAGSDRVLKISGGSCTSSFQVPQNARLDLVTASMSRNGFLVVTVPKVVEEPSRRNVRVVEITE